MKQLCEYSDVRTRGWCVHCGTTLEVENSNRDHVPTKALLRPPPPDSLPIVDVCSECNNSFSLDEEYVVAFLASVISGSTEVNADRFPRAHRALAHSEGLRRRIQESQTRESQDHWRPELDRIERVMEKNARGHWLYETGEAVSDTPTSVRVQPIPVMSERELGQFYSDQSQGDSSSLWPEVGSRSMQRAVERWAKKAQNEIEDSWVEVQSGVYIYSCASPPHLARIRMVIYDYLAAEVIWERG